MTTGILLTGGRDATGAAADVLIGGERIAAVGRDAAAGAAGRDRAASAAGRDTARGDADVLDLTGMVLLPAPAEAHAHLDKALLGAGANPGGTLPGALRAMRAMPMGRADILRRARRAAAIALRHGFTAIRSHVDLGPDGGLSGVEALTELKRDLAGCIDLQIVGLVRDQVTGRDGAAQRRALRAALAAGCDVVGGAPWLGTDPGRSVAELTAAAADAGLPIDLHLDETTDAGMLSLVSYLARVEQLGLGGRAVASHCVSLGQQDAAVAAGLARALAGAGVALVTLPQTNLGLQGRNAPTRLPRALPPLRLLEEAGVLVAAGGDNWRDPFNPVGRIDPMETASLLVSAGHLSAARAYELVSTSARTVLGLAPAALRAGDIADLMAIRAADIAEAVASGTEERMVWHRGRLVAHTQVRAVTGLQGPGMPSDEP